MRIRRNNPRMESVSPSAMRGCVLWSALGALSVASCSRSVLCLVTTMLLCSCLWRPSSLSAASAPTKPHGAAAERDVGILSLDHHARRSRRQDGDMDLSEILAGRVNPNCTAEVELTFICPMFARCFSLERGSICVCGELNDGAVCPGDVDECLLGSHTCGPGGTCNNDLLGFTCSCHRGYIADFWSTPQCVDIDECQDSQLPCHSAARCVNSIGSFACECQSGYQGDGFDCVDVDECGLNPLSCHPNAVCQNNAGGFLCRCSDGFVGDGLECLEKRNEGLAKVTSVTEAAGFVTSPAFASAHSAVSSSPAAGSSRHQSHGSHSGSLSSSDSDSSEEAAASSDEDDSSSMDD